MMNTIAVTKPTGLANPTYNGLQYMHGPKMSRQRLAAVVLLAYRNIIIMMLNSKRNSLQLIPRKKSYLPTCSPPPDGEVFRIISAFWGKRPPTWRTPGMRQHREKIESMHWPTSKGRLQIRRASGCTSERWREAGNFEKKKNEKIIQ